MHDDYDYGQVNQLLERNLKQYIKTVTCYPERLTKKDYDNVMKEFKHSEKVHVNLMLLEARLQGELLMLVSLSPRVSVSISTLAPPLIVRTAA